MSAESSFFVTGGTVPRDAASYIERNADADLLKNLLAGEFCYVLNTRQMGKSSLSVRTIAALQDKGVKTVFLDLTRFGGQNVTAEQWYLGLLAEAGRALGLRSEFLAYWKANAEFSFVQRFFGALGEVALEKLTEPIVVFVDEIDAALSLTFPVDEFFGALRESFNRRTQDTRFSRLTFCLLGVATPADLISDMRMSPFNIGKRILLTDFTPSEAAPLARHLAGGKPVLERVLHWTGGHPYLTQRLCRAIAEEPSEVKPADVDRLCDSLFLSKSARDSDDNLSFVRNRLLRSEVDLASLLDLYSKVRSGKRVPDDETNPLIPVLRLSGVVRADERGLLRVRNRIYDHVFDKAWVISHMPDAELRRQRVAYRRGVIWATTLSGSVAAALGVLSFVAVGNARQAETNQHFAKMNAERAEKNAQRANKNAQQAEKSAQRANQNEAQARAQEREAQQQRKAAQQQRKAAEEQRKAAEEQRKAAEAARLQATRLAGSLQNALQGQKAATRLAGDNATKARREAEHAGYLFYLSQMPLAQKEADAGNLAGLQKVLNTVTANPGWEWYYHQKTLHQAKLVLRDSGAVYWASYSPDGKRVAIIGDGGVSIWDAETGQRLRQLRPALAKPLIYPLLDFSRNDGGKRLLVSGEDNTAQILDSETGRVLQTMGWNSNPVAFGAAFSPDGRQVISASRDGNVRVWDAATGKLLYALGDHTGESWGMMFPDGKRIATGGMDTTFKIWDTATQKLLITFKEHKQKTNDIRVFPDGNRVITVSGDGTARIWDSRTGKQERVLQRVLGAEKPQGHVGMVRSGDISPDGLSVATAGADGTLRLWDVRTGQERHVFYGHKGSIWVGMYSPDGSHILTAGEDGTVRIWDVKAALVEEEGKPFGSPMPLSTLAFSPDKARFVTGGTGADTTAIWDTNTQRRLLTLATSDVQSVAWSPNGKLVATGGTDQIVRLWDALSGRLRQELPGNRYPIRNLAFSPDSTRIASAAFPEKGSAGAATVWEVDSGKLTWSADYYSPRSVCWSKDGKALYMGSTGGVVVTWELTTGNLAQMIAAGTGVLSKIALSPDGRQLTAASQGGSSAIVNLGTSAVTRLTTSATEVCYSPDGKRIVTAGTDGAIRFWDAQSGAEVLVFPEPSRAIRAVAFSPKDQSLLSVATTANQSSLLKRRQGASLSQVAAWRAEDLAPVRQPVQAKLPLIATSPLSTSSQLLAEVQQGRVPGTALAPLTTPIRQITPRNPLLGEWYLGVSTGKGMTATWRVEPDGAIRVDAPHEGQFFPDVHLGLHLHLKRGRRYVLQLRARANQSLPINVSVGRTYDQRPANAPPTLVGETVSLGPEWRAFRWTFTVTDDTTPKYDNVEIGMGRFAGTYWIADVLLVPLADEKPKTAR